MKYRIYDLSVRAMLNYSKPDGLFYKTVIDKNALRSCIKHSAHEQDDNALFYQILCVLHGNDFKYDSADLVTDLSDVIFYADFSRVFDRDASHPYPDDRLTSMSVEFFREILCKIAGDTSNFLE